MGLNTPLSQQAGYYCGVCDCVLRDSQSYLDHINGKYHNRALGMNMVVERSTVDQVRDSTGHKQHRLMVGHGQFPGRFRSGPMEPVMHSRFAA